MTQRFEIADGAITLAEDLALVTFVAEEISYLHSRAYDLANNLGGRGDIKMIHAASDFTVGCTLNPEEGEKSQTVAGCLVRDTKSPFVDAVLALS